MNLKVYSTIWMSVCGIISGVMLVAGVIKIRNFFKKENAEDFIDLPMLTKHAVAFGLYLLSCTLWTAAVVAVNIKESNLTWAIYYDVSIFDFLAQSIA